MEMNSSNEDSNIQAFEPGFKSTVTVTGRYLGDYMDE